MCKTYMKKKNFEENFKALEKNTEVDLSKWKDIV